MPHCIGALDGKHVRIKCPNNAGSSYFNHKGFHSIVMMALADADAKFLYVSAGAKGSWSDGGIYRRSDLYANLHRLQIPEPEPLESGGPEIPFFFVGDDAFALEQTLMKPFSQTHLSHDQDVFNKRLSRARRIVESAFGQLANRYKPHAHSHTN
jgi:hypothetical protein